MKLSCASEQDLLDAVASGRWPDRAGAALRAHVAGCPVCGDVAVFAAALLEDRHAALADAVVPPPSVLWWRCQLRAREDAARIAARPIVLIQAVATLCALAVCVLLAPAAADSVGRLVATAAAPDWRLTSPDVSVGWMVSTAAYMALPLLAAGVSLVLAPVVVYLALDE